MTPMLAFLGVVASHRAATIPIYFGNFQNGIYAAEFDPADGGITEPKLAAELGYPGFLTRHPKLPVLYAIGADETGSVVASFSILPDGRLTRLNKVDANPGGDTYVSVSKDGSALFTANYSNGTVASYALGPDGKVGARVSSLQQQGRGVVPQQDGPHAHCIDQDPLGRFVLVCDLGADRIYSYKFNPRDASLSSNKPPYVSQPSGFGPRHLVFDRSAKHAYVVNELSAQVTTFDYDAKTGQLSEPRHASSIPEGFKGRKWGAEIALDASGRTLYASNRADDESIAVFRIGKRGNPEQVQVFHGNIHHPRHFAIDPTGGFLLIANMDAGSVEVCRIDSRTGMLSPSGKSVRVPGPSCILFGSRP